MSNGLQNGLDRGLAAGTFEGTRRGELSGVVGNEPYLVADMVVTSAASWNTAPNAVVEPVNV
jgi:hypothetical protein